MRHNVGGVKEFNKVCRRGFFKIKTKTYMYYMKVFVEKSGSMDQRARQGRFASGSAGKFLAMLDSRGREARAHPEKLISFE